MECETIKCKNDAKATYVYTSNRYHFCEECGVGRQEFKEKGLPTSSVSDELACYLLILGGNMSRKPNTQECTFFGRKLSNNSCDDIAVSEGYVAIGSDSDDEIFFHKNDLGELILPEGAVRERVTITCINDGGNDVEPDGEGWCFDIDLEDVLRFAARNCRGVYMRVLREESGSR